MQLEDQSGALEALVSEVLLERAWTSINVEFHVALKQAFPVRKVLQHARAERKLWEALAKWILSQSSPFRVQKSGQFPPAMAFLPLAGPTYDAQLLRDTALLLDLHHSEDIDRLRSFLQNFSLIVKCQKSWNEICTLKGVTQLSTLRLVREDYLPRTASKKPTLPSCIGHSVHLQVAVVVNAEPYAFSISVPAATYERLRRLYRTNSPQAPEEILYRIATVLIRYIRILRSGSLQLCADLRLKERLVQSGYTVIDLCASPLNAFTENSPGAPMVFGSAFYETDRFFGSFGSVLRAELGNELLHRVTQSCRPKWVFTLDIPYDEDFAEALFGDSFLERSLLRPFEGVNGLSVHYVSVIPYWWNIRFTHEKRIGGGATDLSSYLSRPPTVLSTWVSSISNNTCVNLHLYIPKSQYAYFNTENNSRMFNVVDTEIIVFQCATLLKSKDDPVRTMILEMYPDSV